MAGDNGTTYVAPVTVQDQAFKASRLMATNKNSMATDAARLYPWVDNRGKAFLKAALVERPHAGEVSGRVNHQVGFKYFVGVFTKPAFTSHGPMGCTDFRVFSLQEPGYSYGLTMFKMFTTQKVPVKILLGQDIVINQGEAPHAHEGELLNDPAANRPTSDYGHGYVSEIYVSTASFGDIFSVVPAYFERSDFPWFLVGVFEKIILEPTCDFNAKKSQAAGRSGAGKKGICTLETGTCCYGVCSSASSFWRA